MLKKDGRNLLVNTKIQLIHFVNIVMLCECTLCAANAIFGRIGRIATEEVVLTHG